jgi:hypothetical protein
LRYEMGLCRYRETDMGYKNMSNAEYQRKWQSIHPGYNSNMRRNIRNNEKDRVFLHYGGYVCACCGFDNKDALVLDHIHGGGSRQRRSPGISSPSQHYRWIIRNNFPEGYQVLCANCNMAKGNKDKCPINHQAIGQIKNIPELFRLDT